MKLARVVAELVVIEDTSALVSRAASRDNVALSINFMMLTQRRSRYGGHDNVFNLVCTRLSTMWIQLRSRSGNAEFSFMFIWDPIHLGRRSEVEPGRAG